MAAKADLPAPDGHHDLADTPERFEATLITRILRGAS
jgi:hypothetical protein